MDPLFLAYCLLGFVILFSCILLFFVALDSVLVFLIRKKKIDNVILNTLFKSSLIALKFVTVFCLLCVISVGFVCITSPLDDFLKIIILFIIGLLLFIRDSKNLKNKKGAETE